MHICPVLQKLIASEIFFFNLQQKFHGVGYEWYILTLFALQHFLFVFRKYSGCGRGSYSSKAIAINVK